MPKIKMDNFEKLTNYDEIAQQYSSNIDNKTWNKYYERPYILSYLTNLKGKNILDVGCASGFYSKYCIENGAKVIGIDASQKILNIAKDKIKSDRFTTFKTDLSNDLNFIESSSQDIIICSLVLHYIENWETPLLEFYRVLKLKGIVIISIHHPFCDYIHLRKDNYFKKELVEDKWKGFGDPLKVRYFTRPLSEVLRPILDSNFRILSIDEPMPIDELKEISIEEYERLCKKPAFLFIRLNKE